MSVDFNYVSIGIGLLDGKLLWTTLYSSQTLVALKLVQFTLIETSSVVSSISRQKFGLLEFRQREVICLLKGTLTNFIGMTFHILIIR